MGYCEFFTIKCRARGNTRSFVLVSKVVVTESNMCHKSSHLQYFCDLRIVEYILPKCVNMYPMSAAKCKEIHYSKKCSNEKMIAWRRYVRTWTKIPVNQFDALRLGNLFLKFRRNVFTFIFKGSMTSKNVKGILSSGNRQAKSD